MKTYWDFSDKERAEMTEEEVTRLLDAELMHKGVFKPTPLALVDLPVVELRRRQVVRISHGSVLRLDVAFETIEQAEAFLKLRPLLCSHSWQSGKSLDVVGTLKEPHVLLEDMPTEDDVHANVAALKKLAEVESANERERRRFDEETKRVTNAVSGVWADWHAQRAVAVQMRKITETRAEYLRLCDGNADLAETFLAKAFNADDLKLHTEWTAGERKTAPAVELAKKAPQEIPF